MRLGTSPAPEIRAVRSRALWASVAVFALAFAAWRLWLVAGGAVPAAPSLADVRAAHRPSDVLVLDRHGEPIQEVRTDPRRRRLGWTALGDISPALVAAVLASEDRRFFAHRGVDWRAVAAALLESVAGRSRRGASTISMQVATFIDPALARRGGPRTLAQKWRQVRLAWRIEGRWTKREILEAYLNLASYRGELEGVAAASAALFGKAPHGLTEAEGATLAVLLRGPNATPEAVARRARALLRSGAGPDVPHTQEGGPGDARTSAAPPDETGAIARAGVAAPVARDAMAAAVTRDEMAAVVTRHQIATAPTRDAVGAAVARALEASTGPGPRVALAPHAARLLVPRDRPPEVVHSTLDAELQRFATESLRRHLSAIRSQRVQDGAILVLDNASGDVLAYVGGSGDLGSARHVDGIRARRQAGSTLKPFLYARALDQRVLTAASLLEDTPLDVPVAGGLYRPRDYDERFKGLVSVRAALGSSLNVPAVRTLGLLGDDVMLEQLRRLGFEGLGEAADFYGPSMALGSVDVSLCELANAYRALARGGLWNSSRLGLEEPAAPSRRVYSEPATFLVSSILSDRESRAVTFGLENPLATRFWTAVKTGTSKEMRDNWCVGYSRRYTVGVWVGNFSGEPMRNVSGVTGAAPVWAEVIAWLHRATPSAPPQPPPGVIASRVAFPASLESDRVEWFVEGTEPRVSAVVATGGHPRIIAPVSGTIVALDPDIPAGRQRLVFEASEARDALRWVLDGEDTGDARDLVVWSPVKGRHTLALVDANARVVDQVVFDVRGPHLRPVPAETAGGF